ncbi:2-hydroxyacid dehydrogenase [Paenibacillus sp. FSL P4-0113]|uniref:2-hydroxyacid dehydrogenase n=1 Tax=Paenibacillus sp. FSL P4-0113 TaxID=2921630 RepID=UPI0030F81215
MLKIICYGVRSYEKPYFQDLNKYNFQLTLVEELLTTSNAELAQHHDAVLLRGNCAANRENITKFNEYGIQYIFTRTVGINHIDLDACSEFGMKVARVPSYSPNAIAELSLTLAMMLFRHTAYMTTKSSFKNFIVDEHTFSKEIHNCKVGIIGVGRIGLTEAKLFKGLGASVIGYDVYQSDAAKEVIPFTTLDELLAESDVVSVHVPYLPGQNDQMINASFLAKMKKGSILINTSRGELQDNQAILDALLSNHLEGFGTDVFPKEEELFFKAFEPWQMLPDPTIQKLVELYPRVLVTPHAGSNTVTALSNMIETSYDNFHDIVTTHSSDNLVPLPVLSMK